MEVARRNNGFRKVAKWIVGAAVVAGAASGNVLCDEVSEPKNGEVDEVKSEVNVNEEDEELRKIIDDQFQEVIGRLPHDPSAVAIVNSRGKSFTNQDIYGLIDHDLYLGLVTRTLSEEEKPKIREGIVELRREKLLDAISFFDQLLSELPADLAQEASKYSYLSEVPEDLANALEDYVKALNDRIEEELDKIREAEMEKMLKEQQKQGN
ncbi:Spherical Body Protein 2 truncated copy 4 (SBP2) [Babesia bovis T2Bo]|uniref:Spherical Body Protein 2 truncated copy 4 (SBP2) n=1 Tax=Babesia bovis TaxID=5865 RepID=A7ANL1_BABBO|nr:Spherical Body Protein 2 truncated copy 4 (SBP2) [Babesia bovis T2Bo]EDO08145.1 Spherical Body Protein 2 truncated copy 4 (SBP2) [Babesia bovis T2Bo]|eukprot:XP_001611713.1 Spherical Body Protein 2 truncated copy 4 (SBP2) [Babesia bovis T2Bo]